MIQMLISHSYTAISWRLCRLSPAVCSKQTTSSSRRNHSTADSPVRLHLLLNKLLIFILMALFSNAVSAQNTNDMENKFIISANGKNMTATFADNSSATAFRSLLAEAPLVVEMSDYGNFEKVGPLGHNLPSNDTRITTQAGDVILYLGNYITIYYDTNTWSFTRLGRIDGNPTRESILSILGSGNVNVTFSLADASAGIQSTENDEQALNVHVSGRNLCIDGTPGDVIIYNAEGKCVYHGSDTQISLPSPGIYLITDGKKKVKIMVQ